MPLHPPERGGRGRVRRGDTKSRKMGLAVASAFPLSLLSKSSSNLPPGQSLQNVALVLQVKQKGKIAVS